ncbi:TetR family transcriptional regulator [Seongchinamella sediminis]|uniref:TetR family transcriptional regulator n=1 Tax=Seongchinamella sediminis TaxID=2283635 RepID=A0A3L7DWA4_9GAMM|nr:TetR/AcrR family transcriptional regulator [Seongchinamella sediminis]RLQ20513.1 TetR family transcriptional regulator [Seongchinamella sediminis]
MSDTRTANMEKRRRRIIAAAHTLLAEGGFDSLNLRDLAAAAEVTVPTIYNLVGNKTALFEALVADNFASYEIRLRRQLPCPVLELPALMISTLVDMIAEDEPFYRASHLASEHLRTTPGDGGERDLKRPTLVRLGRELWQQAQSQGLVRGEIDRDTLIAVMINNQQLAMSDWAHQLITLEEMRKRSLQGFYIVLAADAAEAFRAEIEARLSKL